MSTGALSAIKSAVKNLGKIKIDDVAATANKIMPAILNPFLYYAREVIYAQSVRYPERFSHEIKDLSETAEDFAIYAFEAHLVNEQKKYVASLEKHNAQFKRGNWHKDIRENFIDLCEMTKASVAGFLHALNLRATSDKPPAIPYYPPKGTFIADIEQTETDMIKEEEELREAKKQRKILRREELEKLKKEEKEQKEKKKSNKKAKYTKSFANSSDTLVGDKEAHKDKTAKAAGKDRSELAYDEDHFDAKSIAGSSIRSASSSDTLVGDEEAQEDKKAKAAEKDRPVSTYDYYHSDDDDAISIASLTDTLLGDEEAEKEFLKWTGEDDDDDKPIVEVKKRVARTPSPYELRRENIFKKQAIIMANYFIYDFNLRFKHKVVTEYRLADRMLYSLNKMKRKHMTGITNRTCQSFGTLIVLFGDLVRGKEVDEEKEIKRGEEEEEEE